VKKYVIWIGVLVLAMLTGGCGKGPGRTGVSKETTPELEQVITNSIDMKLVLIPAGEFLIGSPENDRFDCLNQHQVRIKKPFYLGIHEVTVGQFRRFADDTKYKTDAERHIRGGQGWNETEGKLEWDPKYTWREPGFKQDRRSRSRNVERAKSRRTKHGARASWPLVPVRIATGDPPKSG